MVTRNWVMLAKKLREDTGGSVLEYKIPTSDFPKAQIPLCMGRLASCRLSQESELPIMQFIAGLHAKHAGVLWQIGIG